jgi:hypothetical protein
MAVLLKFSRCLLEGIRFEPSAKLFNRNQLQAELSDTENGRYEESEELGLRSIGSARQYTVRGRGVELRRRRVWTASWRRRNALQTLRNYIADVERVFGAGCVMRDSCSLVFVMVAARCRCIATRTPRLAHERHIRRAGEHKYEEEGNRSKHENLTRHEGKN